MMPWHWISEQSNFPQVPRCVNIQPPIGTNRYVLCDTACRSRAAGGTAGDKPIACGHLRLNLNSLRSRVDFVGDVMQRRSGKWRRMRRSGSRHAPGAARAGRPRARIAGRSSVRRSASGAGAPSAAIRPKARPDPSLSACHAKVSRPATRRACSSIPTNSCLRSCRRRSSFISRSAVSRRGRPRRL